jgi:protein involved in polysaccharide export with SLBB domain
MVSFPLVGDIEVNNMGLSEFRDLFAKKLDKYIVDPQVIIQVTLSMSNKIYVLGEVRKPGIYSLEEPRTISEAISFAGGFTYNAKKKGVVLMRKGEDGVIKPVALDIDMIMNGKETEKDVYLQRGDVVYVPLSNVALVDRFFYHLNTALGGILGTQQAVINYPAVENVTSQHYKDNERTQTQTIIVPITPP